MTPKPRSRANDDTALTEDIRYLGRILGDTIREQAGTETFDLVESIRHAAIRYRRDHDAASLEEVEKTIRSLDQASATNVVRAFSYFHLLANTAEDLHRNGSVSAERRRARGERDPRHRTGAQGPAADPQAGGLLRARAHRAGPDRPPHRGAAQEHPRPASGDHRRAWPAAARRKTTIRACVARFSFSGRRVSFVPSSRRWPTKSKTGSPIFVPPFSPSCRRLYASHRRRARLAARCCRRSCGSPAGSAAIATATRTSPTMSPGTR